MKNFLLSVVSWVCSIWFALLSFFGVAPKLPSGEVNGVRWQVLDLEKKANAEIRDWLKGENCVERASEHPMGNGKTIVERGLYPNHQILLRDEATGEETVLLESWEDAGDPCAGESPRFSQLLDDRYFIYQWIGWEWEAGCGVYDTVRMKEIPVKAPDDNYAHVYEYDGVCENTLLVGNAGYACYVGPLYLHPVDLERLDEAEFLVMGDNILEGIPQADEENVVYMRVFCTPDKRYLIAEEDNGAIKLRIFDLQRKTFVGRVDVTEESVSNSMTAFRDDRTLYFYDKRWNKEMPERYVLELQFP